MAIKGYVIIGFQSLQQTMKLRAELIATMFAFYSASLILITNKNFTRN
jgi:hypothetical protein